MKSIIITCASLFFSYSLNAADSLIICLLELDDEPEIVIEREPIEKIAGKIIRKRITNELIEFLKTNLFSVDIDGVIYSSDHKLEGIINEKPDSLFLKNLGFNDGFNCNVQGKWGRYDMYFKVIFPANYPSERKPIIDLIGCSLEIKNALEKGLAEQSSQPRPQDKDCFSLFNQALTIYVDTRWTSNDSLCSILVDFLHAHASLCSMDRQRQYPESLKQDVKIELLKDVRLGERGWVRFLILCKNNMVLITDVKAKIIISDKETIDMKVYGEDGELVSKKFFVEIPAIHGALKVAITIGNISLDYINCTL